MSFRDDAKEQLGETLKLVAETAVELGIDIGDEVKALLDPHSVSFTGGTIRSIVGAAFIRAVPGVFRQGVIDLAQHLTRIDDGDRFPIQVVAAIDQLLDPDQCCVHRMLGRRFDVAHVLVVPLITWILYLEVHRREYLDSRHTDGAAHATGGPTC